MDLDGPLHPDVYDGVGADQRGHELVASPDHHSAWQHDRPCAHIAQFASRNKIWHSVSRVCPGGIWDERLKSAGTDACDRGLRMVRNTGMDRRTGFTDFFRSIYSWLGVVTGRSRRRPHADRVAIVPDILGHKHRHYL